MKNMSLALNLFLTLFLAIGVFILGAGAVSLQRATAAAAWPTTAGRLDDVQLVTDRDPDGVSWRVALRYTYEVDGRRHAGSNLAFGYGGSSDRAPHEAILARLAGARSVEVRYDPERPDRSTLTYGANHAHYAVLAFGATWLLFTLGFWAIGWLSSRSDAGMLERLVVLG